MAAKCQKQTQIVNGVHLDCRAIRGQKIKCRGGTLLFAAEAAGDIQLN
jgi:hypothetical protein